MKKRQYIYQCVWTLGLLVVSIFIFLPRITNAAAPASGVFDINGNRLVNITAIPMGSSIDALDVDNDGRDELIVGSQPGVAPTVSIFKLDGTLVHSFSVYSLTLRTGVNVKAGSMKGSNEVRILVTARKGALARVFQYLSDGTLVGSSFLAYPETFRGGAYATYGDVDGDGVTEIITSPGFGMRVQMKRFTLAGQELADAAYVTSFDSTCGMSVTAGDAALGVNHGDGFDEVYFTNGCRLTPGLEEFNPRYSQNLDSGWFQSMLVGLDTDGPVINLRRVGLKWVNVTSHHAGRRTYIGYNLRTDYINSQDTLYPFPDTWLGGASAVAVDLDGAGTLGFAVVPGALTLTAKELQYYARDPFSGSKKSYSTMYFDKRVTTSSGTFRVHYVQVNLRSPKVRIVTAQSLISRQSVEPIGKLMQPYNAIAAINGGFMGCDILHNCGPGVTAWYDTAQKKFNPSAHFNRFNFVFDSTNRWYYFGTVDQVGDSDGKWLGTQAFKVKNGTQMTAAFGNGMRSANVDLLEAGQVVPLPPKIRTAGRARRGAFGVKGDEAFMVVIDGANLYDTALVMKALGVEYATMLDGGGSSALYYRGQYKIGPGRNIGNAIVISAR